MSSEKYVSCQAMERRPCQDCGKYLCGSSDCRESSKKYYTKEDLFICHQCAEIRDNEKRSAKNFYAALKAEFSEYPEHLATIKRIYKEASW